MNDKLEILYEDKSIIVINKPAGLATQSANVSQRDCVSLIKEHLRRNNSSVKGELYVGVIHRLDQPVSGILVFAKNQKAAASLSKQVQSDFMNKQYKAVVEGKLWVAEKNREKCCLKNLMYKNSKDSKAVVINKKEDAPKGVKVSEGILEYSVEEYRESEDETVLNIKLITGRFHQIRAQLSNIGHPILGDRKYGSTRDYKGIALSAIKLEFVHPDTGEKKLFCLKNI